jgi:hypothetical protein
MDFRDHIFFNLLLDKNVAHPTTWIEIHKDELIADWELAVSGKQPYKIEPLR